MPKGASTPDRSVIERAKQRATLPMAADDYRRTMTTTSDDSTLPSSLFAAS